MASSLFPSLSHHHRLIIFLPVDTKYPFYYASGFFGQACAGGNAHCSFDFDGGKHNCAKCGKIVTDNDDGPNGPGHVPPHIGLAALTR